jgi:hypothetical protein
MGEAAFNRAVPERWPYFCVTGTQEHRVMKLTSWGILAFVGSVIFSLFFIKDWETKMDAQKLSRVKLPHHSGLDVDPNLKLVSERSPYMRSER